MLSIAQLEVSILVQAHCSHEFNDYHQLWLQQIAEEFTSYCAANFKAQSTWH